MNILFLHPNFPAQFRHLAAVLAKGNHRVVFGTARRQGEIPGVRKVLYAPTRKSRPETHHYVRFLENAVLQGQAVYRLVSRLKAEGFIPDIVYGHSGWGPTLFVKDAFPRVKLLCYFEWFYNAHGSSNDFDPAYPLSDDDRAKIRILNTAILTDLWSCDGGLSPTSWQHAQFPSEFRGKIRVLHDGIDANYFRPAPDGRPVIPEIGSDPADAGEIVTYVSRGMEPYRGFPQFMEAASLLLKRRPRCHVIVVGEDRVAYGKQLPEGRTFKKIMMEKLEMDPARLHFTGWLPYDRYLRVLQASSAHVYLTYPFVLSWSMLEAMSAGCLVVASGTPPVTEVIRDRENGLLVDFFSPREIADRVEETLDNPEGMKSIRANARETILGNYDLAKLLPRHLDWVREA